MSAMKEKVEILAVSDLKPIFDELDAMRTAASALRENCQPIFQGKHYLTDSSLSRRLNLCKRTLATYRANGMLGYYNILYSDTDVEDFLQRHYLPPFRWKKLPRPISESSVGNNRQ